MPNSLPLFIARRYLFSKKSTSAINAISAISAIGVAVATMALVVVLSVFNGFHDLVASFFTNVDPQLKVVPAKGKTAPVDDPVFAAIKALPEVSVASECVEDRALAMYGGKQAMVTIKGVDDNFGELTRIGDVLYGDGDFQLYAAGLQYGVPGIRLAGELGATARYKGHIYVFAPIKDGQVDLANPSSSFAVDSLISPGVLLAVNQGKYDKGYIFTSVSFARALFGEQGMASSLELRLEDGSDIDKVKAKIEGLAGGKYIVQDRFEQQADTFRIMAVEKFIAYIFLTFILIVACINIIGSLSMLMIDKKKDAGTLRSLGASDTQISRIFLYEGWMISVAGAAVGVLLGLALCWVQQEFGIVTLGENSGSFVINAYPVSVHYWDVAMVAATVVVVGWLSAWYPAKFLAKRLLGK